MRLPEFVEAVESYGVPCPRTNTNSLPSFWRDLVGILPIGSGYRQHYDKRYVRLLVSWQLISRVSGDHIGDGWEKLASVQRVQRRQAMRLLAAAPEGWVVMADGRAWWSLVPPVRTLRSRCAVAIPVPAWKH